MVKLGFDMHFLEKFGPAEVVAVRVVVTARVERSRNIELVFLIVVRVGFRLRCLRRLLVNLMQLLGDVLLQRFVCLGLPLEFVRFRWC